MEQHLLGIGALWVGPNKHEFTTKNSLNLFWLGENKIFHNVLHWHGGSFVFLLPDGAKPRPSSELFWVIATSAPTEFHALPIGKAKIFLTLLMQGSRGTMFISPIWKCWKN